MASGEMIYDSDSSGINSNHFTTGMTGYGMYYITGTGMLLNGRVFAHSAVGCQINPNWWK